MLIVTDRKCCLINLLILHAVIFPKNSPCSKPNLEVTGRISQDIRPSIGHLSANHQPGFFSAVLLTE